MSCNLCKEKIAALNKQFGEAYYILDSGQFRQNYMDLKDAFASVYPRFNIAYSYKTNYIPRLCRAVNELGGYAETVSEMEAELALRTGVKPGNIIWNGPVKDIAYAEKFLLSGSLINIDSFEEAAALQSLAQQHPDRTFRLGIRCNFDIDDGVVSRFGLDIHGEDFKKTAELITGASNIEFAGLQCHFADRSLDHWPARARGILEAVDIIGTVPDIIDLGGGIFGKMEDSLKEQFSVRIPEYREYANAVASVFLDSFGDTAPLLLIEPGSALVGDCMKFMGTVKSIKSVRGKYFASLLASQKNINMSGVNPPIEVINMGGAQKEYKDLDMAGYTCIENDILYRNYSGPLAVGDAVLFGNCGSYSVVMKPPFILPDFPIIDISGGEAELVKEAESFEDIFRRFTF
ncbi:MAG: pyridoxal-dependent decarboxylase [Clostridiales bacterium]|nr:pyridoxal-dependent decarboxylase [Clostridiales bacterium]